MAKRKKRESKKTNGNGANLGFEAKLCPSYGDLIYSREGAYHGIAAEIPEDSKVCLGQRTVLIRSDETKANFRFLRYWLNYDRV